MPLPARSLAGDGRALDAIHVDLRRLASRLMAAERTGHTLQPTSLVNEAFLRLRRVVERRSLDEPHLLALFARTMRRLLVDHARRRRVRREAIVAHASLGERQRDDDYLPALDAALARLAKREPRLTRLVELRFFGGLTVPETARALDVSVRTVVRDWAVAKAWLQRSVEAGGTVG